MVIDMQNDFIDVALGTKRAERILPAVAAKIAEYKNNGNDVIFTRDTHYENYPETLEGRNLPVPHCIENTPGHDISSLLDTIGCEIINKNTFGSLALAELAAAKKYDEIELCGLCTDICVVSNALILRAALPDTEIKLDAGCCAGVTEESHEAALATMRMCQISVYGANG